MKPGRRRPSARLVRKLSGLVVWERHTLDGCSNHHDARMHRSLHTKTRVRTRAVPCSTGRIELELRHEKQVRYGLKMDHSCLHEGPTWSWSPTDSIKCQHDDCSE